MKTKTILRAIDSCIMPETGRKTLTIGKEYVVVFETNRQINITDDDNESHYFDLDNSDPDTYWGTFFVKTV